MTSPMKATKASKRAAADKARGTKRERYGERYELISNPKKRKNPDGSFLPIQPPKKLDDGTYKTTAPDEQRKCCSKYKKPNFHMACKALGCKTTRCPRFYGSRINRLNDGDSSSSSDGSSSEEELSLAQQFASGYHSESISLNDSTSASTSSKEELSLAQQFATMDNDTVNFNNDKNEDNEASPCGESGVCHSSTIQRYDTLISFTYQDGDIVERDCIMYRCRDYPYSLWCTNELYVPGSENGGIAWDRIGPCL